MKITTKFFNDEFIEAQARLYPMSTKNEIDFSTLIYPFNGSGCDPSDLEDAKMNRIRVMKDQKLDYAKLSSMVLTKCGIRREPETTFNFLKKRSGTGACGHYDQISKS